MTRFSGAARKPDVNVRFNWPWTTLRADLDLLFQAIPTSIWGFRTRWAGARLLERPRDSVKES